MSTALTYIEALLLEQVEEGKAEVNENSSPVTVYVNERIADDGVMPIIFNLDIKGCLRRENLTNGHYAFSISEKGRQLLQQSLMRKKTKE